MVITWWTPVNCIYYVFAIRNGTSLTPTCNSVENNSIFFRFSSIWNEVEELWLIMTKEFLRAAKASQEIQGYISQSRLPHKINDLLSCKTIDPEIAENYRLFNAFLKSAKK